MSGHLWGWLCGVVMNPKAVYSVQLACFLCCNFTKRKYTLSSALILSQVQCQWLCRGTSPTARKQILPRLCCSSFHQGETCQTNDLTFPGIHRCWGLRWIQLPFLCAHPPPCSTSVDSTCLLAKVIKRCSCISCRRQDEADWRSGRI